MKRIIPTETFSLDFSRLLSVFFSFRPFSNVSFFFPHQVKLTNSRLKETDNQFDNRLYRNRGDFIYV